MFEKYTESARRAILFAFGEANQLGSPFIETENLHLGICREDSALANRFLPISVSTESIRKQIEDSNRCGESFSPAPDLPLSGKCLRVFAYTLEEAERLSDKLIGTEHLRLGLLREEKCVAAKILNEGCALLSDVREKLQH